MLIYVDLDKALRAGIKFYLSSNGVVLTKGDSTGYLRPEFFKLVTDIEGTPLPGWNCLIGSPDSPRKKNSGERLGTVAAEVEDGGSAVLEGSTEVAEDPATASQKPGSDTESASKELEVDMKQMSIS